MFCSSCPDVGGRQVGDVSCSGVCGVGWLRPAGRDSRQNDNQAADGHAESVRPIFCLRRAEQSVVCVCVAFGRCHLSGA